MREMHDAPTEGRLGRGKTYTRLTASVYWRGSLLSHWCQRCAVAVGEKTGGECTTPGIRLLLRLVCREQGHPPGCSSSAFLQRLAIRAAPEVPQHGLCRSSAAL